MGGGSGSDSGFGQSLSRVRSLPPKLSRSSGPATAVGRLSGSVGPGRGELRRARAMASFRDGFTNGFTVSYRPTVLLMIIEAVFLHRIRHRNKLTRNRMHVSFQRLKLLISYLAYIVCSIGDA